MAEETWIIYKASDEDAPGWKERRLMPSGSLTDILHEERDWSNTPPQVGDHVPVFANLEDPGNGITHGRDGDWLVSDVETFTSKRDSTRIVVCYCTYAPITPQWEAIERGAPVEDLVTA
jgi:hypothetical protein